MSDLFATGMSTSPGGRQYNEDFMLHASIGDTHCWVLADGLGGHGGGETASRVACNAAVESFRANQEVSAAALADHIGAANGAVQQAQTVRPELARMRTTIVVLVCNSASAIWGHTGDSRLYHFRAGQIRSQTKDHSMPQSLVQAGEIRPEDIRHHPDRNRLLRVLGEEGVAQPSVLPGPVTLCAGDAFLLCSDGLWENVWELEMELDFAKSQTPSRWLELLELRLQERVSGSHDNYSAVAVIGDRLRGTLFSLPPAAPTLAAVAPRESGGALRLCAYAMLPVAIALAVAAWTPAGMKKPFEEAAMRAWRKAETLPILPAKQHRPPDNGKGTTGQGTAAKATGGRRTAEEQRRTSDPAGQSEVKSEDH